MNLNRFVAVALALGVLTGCGDEKKTGKRAPESLPMQTASAGKENPHAPKAEDKKPEPASPPVPVGDDALSVKLKDGRTVTVPKTWKEQPAGQMRLAQFGIPKAANDAEDGELAVFIFPAGGGVDANLKRWVSQFGDAPDAIKAKRTTKTAAGVEATIAELEGTYTAMTMAGSGEPKKGYKLLGAIIVTDKGEYYFKLAAPQATADANKAAFDKMIESFK